MLRFPVRNSVGNVLWQKKLQAEPKIIRIGITTWLSRPVWPIMQQ